jgi:YfiH family protein
MHLKSPLLSQVPGVRHGFGSWSEPVPAPFQAEWEALKARWTQVHKIDVCEIRGPSQVCGEVDALYSYAAGVPVAVMHADCTPILLARRDGGAVAAVHAGWRGTHAHILSAAWRALEARGERARDWVASVGPTIGPCCYEVSEEIAADFAREFAALGPGVAVPRHRMLDLPAINAAELRALGLGEVELLRACTRCSVDAASGEPLYCSYRRDQSKTRQYSVIGRVG